MSSISPTQALLFILAFFGAYYTQAEIVLENSNARFSFDDNTFGLSAIEYIQNGNYFNFLNDSAPHPLWELHFRDEQGVEYVVDGSAVAERRTHQIHNKNSTSSLILTWINSQIPVINLPVNVSVEILLLPVGLVDSKITIGAVGGDLALNHYYFFIVTNIGTKNSSQDTVYVPGELGFKNQDPRGFWWSARYPSGPASMPFMLFHHKINSTMEHMSINCSRGLGLFYGALEVHPSQKDLNVYPTQLGLQMSVRQYPENNILPHNKQLVSRVSFIIGPYCGDWWDGAQIYRSWALNNAPWTSAGPIKYRSDIPQWYKDTTLWINSHWVPGNLNNSLGDPSVIEANVNKFITAFSQSKYFNASTVALHWYVWHQVAWQTNYPHYFPARGGFRDVSQRLQKQGIKIFPYINGRVYDINNQSWSHDEAEIHCCKSSAARSKPLHVPLQLEMYSNNQYWAVICPSTKFWQDKLTALTVGLTNDYKTNGVYIDQLASKDPALCYDPHHNHPRGGGSYWSDGYNKALKQIRSAMTKTSVLTSESNAEVYLNHIDGFLTIGGYNNCPIVPMFQAVYSDYAIIFGRYFPGASVHSNATAFTQMMAQMFVFGSQLGWFALDGNDGLLPFLANETNFRAVDYVSNLTRFRTLGAEYLLYGRLMRPLDTIPSDISTVDSSCYAKIASAVWRSQGGDLGLFVVNGGSSSQQFEWTMDAVKDYGLDTVDKYTLLEVNIDGTSNIIGQFSSAAISGSVQIHPLQIHFYRILPHYKT